MTRSFFASRLLLVRAFALSVLIGSPVGLAVAEAQATAPQPATKSFTGSFDLSLGVFGQLTPTRAPIHSLQGSDGFSQVTQGTSASAGVLGTFHQAIRPWIGYNVNAGYTRFEEMYSSGFSYSSPTDPLTGQPPYSYTSFTRGNIPTNMYELTVAYAVEGPKTRRFSTSAQVGGGGLFFLPTMQHQEYAFQMRAAMVFGVGATYRITPRLGLKAEYRGLFYKNPDFRSDDYTIPTSKLFTVTSEPAVSLVYTFGTHTRVSERH